MKRLFLLLICLLLTACAAPTPPLPPASEQPWSPPVATQAPLSPEAQNMRQVLSLSIAYAEHMAADFPDTHIMLDAQEIAYIEAHLNEVDDDLRADLRALILNLRQQTFLSMEDMTKSGHAVPIELSAALTAFEEALTALGW